MDNYHSTPPHLALTRIKDLLAHTEYPYTANPCLTAHDLAIWEAANDVSLPEAYRLFLLEIGNGGMMPGSYCDFEMRPLDLGKVDSRFREPFPITRERFEQRMTEGRRNDPFLFPDLSQYREEGLPPVVYSWGTIRVMTRFFWSSVANFTGRSGVL